MALLVCTDSERRSNPDRQIEIRRPGTDRTAVLTGNDVDGGRRLDVDVPVVLLLPRLGDDVRRTPLVKVQA